MITPTLSHKHLSRSWHLVDLKGATLGRTATQIARLLIGKHKPVYSPHLDAGDFVVAINAQLLNFTGKKLTAKVYTRYSGFPGGLKRTTLGEQLQKDARQVLRHAVLGMLPKNKLRSPRLARLKIFNDATHPYVNKITQKSQ